MLASLHQVTKYYEQAGKRHMVLQDLSLTIEEGESIAIVGPSGSGKSTLLNILGTLDRPSSGTMQLNGRMVDRMGDKQLALVRRSLIGFVFQMHHLLPQLTLLENVLLPLVPEKDPSKREQAENRALLLLERFGLCDQLTRRPAHLSVGECQRAAVVRALVHSPLLVLADEPTGSLDELHASELGNILAELNHEHQIALVVVTHSLELAQRMNRIYKLSSGHLHPIEKR